MADSVPPTKRRFLDRAGRTPTLIGSGSRMEGELHCPGDLSVAGSVIGKGDIAGMLSVADSGQWQGVIHCGQALVAGLIDGELVVSGKLEVRATARIKGNVTAAQIAIAEGAVVEADIVVTTQSPVQRFSERRALAHGS